MTATRDLIATALTAAGAVRWQYPELSDDLREACARAISETQPVAWQGKEGIVRHTPGPWHWESDPIKGDPLGRVCYRVTAIGKTVTQCYYSSGDKQAEWDARLIAAAPDLLEALKVAVSIIGHPSDKISKYLSAVIAYAEGLEAAPRGEVKP